MNEQAIRSRSRRGKARLYLSLLLPALLLGDYFLWQFATDKAVTSFQWLIGILCGVALAQILLVIAMWRRNGWSRYVFLALNWLLILTFAGAALFTASDIHSARKQAEEEFALKRYEIAVAAEEINKREGTVVASEMMRQAEIQLEKLRQPDWMIQLTKIKTRGLKFAVIGLAIVIAVVVTTTRSRRIEYLTTPPGGATT